MWGGGGGDFLISANKTDSGMWPFLILLEHSQLLRPHKPVHKICKLHPCPHPAKPIQSSSQHCISNWDSDSMREVTHFSGSRQDQEEVGGAGPSGYPRRDQEQGGGAVLRKLDSSANSVVTQQQCYAHGLVTLLRTAIAWYTICYNILVVLAVVHGFLSPGSLGRVEPSLFRPLSPCPLP